MSIQFIANGYYRSGTTLLWKTLAESNPDHVVFYEPLHPQLSQHLAWARRNRETADSLHQEKLWNSYMSQAPQFLTELSQTHVFASAMYPERDEQLFKYLDVYDHLPQPSILQTNRLHFHLARAAQRYRCPSLHIVRNPVDVFRSLARIHTLTTNRLWGALYRLKNGHPGLSGMWRTKRTLSYAYDIYEIPEVWGDMRRRQEVLRDPFLTHLLAWTVCNYLALYGTQRSNTAVISYEMLTEEPARARIIIERLGDVRFALRHVRVRPGRLARYREKNVLDGVERLGVTSAYEAILSAVTAERTMPSSVKPRTSPEYSNVPPNSRRGDSFR